jgi:Resolvase, N terminal domain
VSATRVGYARVSTADQNPDHQIDALLRHGVGRDNIHVDTASGAKASRPRLELVLQLLRPGDTLKITRLDRLSRSVLNLVTLGANLRGRGIGLHVIEQGIDTSTVEGRDVRHNATPTLHNVHYRRATTGVEVDAATPSCRRWRRSCRSTRTLPSTGNDTPGQHPAASAQIAVAFLH